MRKGISFVLSCICIIIVFSAISVSAITADNNIGVELAFDKTEYKPGDVAEVTLFVTDIDDEEAVGEGFGFFETYLKFDSAELEFLPIDAESIKSEWCIAFGQGETNIFEPTTSYDDIIMVAFGPASSVPIRSDNGKMAIAKIRFKVLDSPDAELTVAFHETHISDAGGNNNGYSTGREYTCIAGTAATAKISDTYYFYDDTASINSSGTITDSLHLRAKNGGIFIAKLYNADTLEMAAPPKILTINGNFDAENQVLFENIEPGSYKMDYFFWNGFITLKPISPKKTITVE